LPNQQGEVVVLEPGEYMLEVLRASVRGSGIFPIYRVVDGPHEGKLASLGGLMLTERSAPIFFRNLSCFGLNRDFMVKAKGLQDIAKALVGRVVKAQVGKRQWKGKDRNDFPIGGLELVAIARREGVVLEPPVVEVEGVCQMLGISTEEWDARIAPQVQVRTMHDRQYVVFHTLQAWIEKERSSPT